MATGYEPNVEGAITVLIDLMTANNFTMTRQPYEPNYRGLVDAIIDVKDGFPVFSPTRVTACPDPDGAVVVIAPAVVGLKKYKSPGSIDDIVFIPATKTLTSFPEEAAESAKPTTCEFSRDPSAALAFPTLPSLDLI